MLVGLISDTHDNLTAVRSAITIFDRAAVGHVVHAGDIVAQFVLAEFGRSAAPMTLVFGNNDGDRGALQARAAGNSWTLTDGPHAFELDGRRLVVSHGPVPAPDCDFYIHGHTHRLRVAPGRPMTINPGEACGWLTGRRRRPCLHCDR